MYSTVFVFTVLNTVLYYTCTQYVLQTVARGPNLPHTKINLARSRRLFHKFSSTSLNLKLKEIVFHYS